MARTHTAVLNSRLEDAAASVMALKAELELPHEAADWASLVAAELKGQLSSQSTLK